MLESGASRNEAEEDEIFISKTLDDFENLEKSLKDGPTFSSTVSKFNTKYWLNKNWSYLVLFLQKPTF